MVFSITPRVPAGGTIPMMPLPRKAAFRQLERYLNTSVRGKFQAGGFVDLRKVPEDIPIAYVGDLHARVDNLNRILNSGSTYERLRNGQLVLNILGDAVHREDGNTEMDSSVVMMQQIMDLKIMCPDNFYYYAGNHDSFSMRAMLQTSAGLIFPGVIMSMHLQDLYGDDYVRRFQELISGLPMVSAANGVVTAHGGPVRRPFTMEQLINASPANETDPIVRDIVWGRFECVEDPSLSYDMSDVQRFLSDMDQPDAALLVAHTKPKNRSWHREIARNHHVIFGALDPVGYALLHYGELHFLDASGASHATTGRLPIEFYVHKDPLPQGPKRPADEIVRTNAELFNRGGLYDRGTADETIVALDRSDVETNAFAAQDGTLVAFGNERHLSYELTEMLMQGLLYKIEISEVSVSRKPGQPRFFCTLPSNMPENIRDIILRTIERVNRTYVVEHNRKMLLDHVGSSCKAGRTSTIPLIVQPDGRIVRIADVDSFDEPTLTAMDRGELKFVKIVLSKPRFWGKPVYSLPMNLASLLDPDTYAVAKMTVEELNKG